MTTAPAPEKKKMSIWLKILIGFIVLMVLGRLSRESQDGNTGTPAASAPTASTPEGITMAKYSQLQTGMSYEQVKSILGAAGEEMSSNEIGGTRTVMYQWKAGGFGANMNAMFQNDKLIQKAQAGLE